MSEKSYVKSPQNAVNRLRNRANYDYETIHNIVNSTAVLHVSFVPSSEDPFPVVLPMIGQMGTFALPSSTDLDQPLDLYLHGAIASRIMKLSQNAVDRGEEGFPLCVAATKVDGYVLALTPFHHSYNFRSAVVHGYAHVVADPDEKMWALELITNKIVPERWQNTRTPPNKVEMQSTHILKMKVSSGSAKLRWGVPNNDRGDLKNPDVLANYWAGVVPMWETFGEPISSAHNQAPVPKYLSGYLEEARRENEAVAMEASKEQE
ncbi:hypothetical protein BU24DRAFT_441988 [Aaosphaeria arxii CBS 175.79]|uniref:5-nitroimidazole antibiotic resistance protein n=1 Tax=Aaosphaeria arxii CBS 175.79 TaxID=1450172 RepID=A0A6A5XQU9_9PLEO|nr:uncharacterized protein BU24DRAFT_441988 [Aaosphaeria arxii CBS 175.79]KAF2014674.1 hypothetical protein BU24DRAFT_441988 [Aaosphaeria arxii CBS 175.79]